MGPSEHILSSQLLHAAHLNLITNNLKNLSHEWLTFVFHQDELPIQIVILGTGLGTGCLQVDPCGIAALADMWSVAEAGDLPVHYVPWLIAKVPFTGATAS